MSSGKMGCFDAILRLTVPKTSDGLAALAGAMEILQSNMGVAMIVSDGFAADVVAPPAPTVASEPRVMTAMAQAKAVEKTSTDAGDPSEPKGMAAKRSRRPWTRDDTTTVSLGLEAGKTGHQIAAEMKRSTGQVYRVIQELRNAMEAGSPGPGKAEGARP
jgi:hypothetical protein